MGLPVAQALAGLGLDVLGFDRNPARVSLATAEGVTCAHSVSAVHEAPMVLTLLPDDAALSDFCLGPQGMLATSRGGMHVCLGTLGVATAQAMEEEHARGGRGFVACPVFGRPNEARERDLTAVFGASNAAPADGVARARALVSRLAPRLHEVASPSAACAVKLAGNQMIAGAIASMAECLGLVEAHGVPPPLLHAIVTGKLFRGPVYEGVGRMLAGVVAPPAVAGFTLRLGLKDLVLCAQAASDAGFSMPVADAVRARLAGAVIAGHGDRDWGELSHCLPIQPVERP